MTFSIQQLFTTMIFSENPCFNTLAKNMKSYRYLFLFVVCVFKLYRSYIILFYLQSAALVAVANVYEYIDEVSIKRMVMPKIKAVYEKNQSDLKIITNVLQCIERILDKLDKSQVWISVE
jgi:hypothetical protein